MTTLMPIRSLIRKLILPALILCLPFAPTMRGQGAPAKLPPPGFHHLHLNSLDPDAAIAFYTQQFPSTSKSAFAGIPALKSGNVYVLFTKVSAPPPTEPQTAIWHFGWHVVDVRKNLDIYLERKVHLLPLYTTDEGASVWVSSDTWPGAGGTLGRNKAQIAEARATGVQPRGGAGFAYLQAPDGAIVEYQGDMPSSDSITCTCIRKIPTVPSYGMRSISMPRHFQGQPDRIPTPKPIARCRVASAVGPRSTGTE